MKISLDAKDYAEIKRTEEHNSLIKYLKNKDRVDFNIGDILIHKSVSDWTSDDKPIWSVETTSSTNGLPRRYVCVYKDEFGICYLKRLKVSNGELGEELICMADCDFHLEVYEVDPLFLDSMLLGDGSFNIKELQKKEKERKKEIIDFNQRSVFRGFRLDELNKFLLQLKNGDTLYQCYTENFLGINLREFKVRSIKEKYISRMSQEDKNDYSEKIENKEICNSTKVVEIGFDDGWSGITRNYSFDFLEKHLYKNKPRSIIGDEQ